jgi:hypothetical protein
MLLCAGTIDTQIDLSRDKRQLLNKGDWEKLKYPFVINPAKFIFKIKKLRDSIET